MAVQMVLPAIAERAGIYMAGKGSLKKDVNEAFLMELLRRVSPSRY